LRVLFSVMLFAIAVTNSFSLREKAGMRGGLSLLNMNSLLNIIRKRYGKIR